MHSRGGNVCHLIYDRKQTDAALLKATKAVRELDVGGDAELLLLGELLKSTHETLAD